MASTIIVWDKRVGLAGGPTSGPGVSNVLRVTCDGSTPMSTLVNKIIAAAGPDKIEALKIFAHGGSGSGGQVALCKERLSGATVAQFAAPLLGKFSEEGRIELHSCLVARNAGVVGSAAWMLLSCLAIRSSSYVYAAEELQLIWGGKAWDPDWEGNVWIFPPTGP